MFDRCLFHLASLVLVFTTVIAEDLRWCGKHYKAADAADDPGGSLTPPTISHVPLLDLRVRPRMSIYVDGDEEASFIVDAKQSYTIGEPLHYSEEKPTYLTSVTIAAAVNGTKVPLASIGDIHLDSTSTEHRLVIHEHLRPRLTPYNITLTATDSASGANFSASTSLVYLPRQANANSTSVRLDSYSGGGMSILSLDVAPSTHDHQHSNKWSNIFPFGYYVNWGDWLSKNLTADLARYKAAGYNLVHPVPAGGSEPFDPDLFAQFVDLCEQNGLYIMYDMRWTYQNESSITSQVNLLKDRKSLLLWYTADEPDGQQDPLTAPRSSYNLIKSLDPYHPVSLVLNCGNYHFDEYSQGADILLSDAYPVGINATFSTQWNTPCNSTYGDCGCDNCDGIWEDVSDHLDNYRTYNDDWLGRAPKALWGVPQAFGNETYWPRFPTGREEILMDVLSINHGAKGISAWIYPTTTDIDNATAKLGSIINGAEGRQESLSVAQYLTTTKPTPLTVTGAYRMDAAAWVVGDHVLVSMAYLGDDDVEDDVSVELSVDTSDAVVRILSLLSDDDAKPFVIHDNKLLKTGWRAQEVAIVDLWLMNEQAEDNAQTQEKLKRERDVSREH
jgi:hypothetical protein